METGFVLAAVGLGLMFGLSGAGSAIGLVIGGTATLGAIRKKPEGFGVCMILTAVPATQGLYGFVGYILFSSAMRPEMAFFDAAVVFGSGVGMGIVNFISAIWMGKVCASGITSIGMGQNAFVSTLVLAAFPEFYAILGVVGGILMRGLIA